MYYLVFILSSSTLWHDYQLFMNYFLDWGWLSWRPEHVNLGVFICLTFWYAVSLSRLVTAVNNLLN